jgi:hypothetical protein
LINGDSIGQSSLSTHDVPARCHGWAKMMVCRSKLTNVTLKRRAQGRPARAACHSHAHQPVDERRTAYWACVAELARSAEPTVLECHAAANFANSHPRRCRVRCCSARNCPASRAPFPWSILPVPSFIELQYRHSECNDRRDFLFGDRKLHQRRCELLLTICLILAKELMSLEVKPPLLYGFQNREASLSNNLAS